MPDHDRDTEFDPLDVLLEEVLSEPIPAADADALPAAHHDAADRDATPVAASRRRARTPASRHDRRGLDGTADRAPQRSPNRLLTAVLAVVGVGVIAWVTWLRQSTEGPRTAATGEPETAQDGPLVTPTTFDAVRRLLADLIEVRAASRVLTMRSAADELTFAIPPQCETSVMEPDALRRWRQGISASPAAAADAATGSPPNLRLRFELRDGRHLEANANTRTGGLLRFTGLPTDLVPTPELAALLQDAYDEALRHGRRAHGIASSLEELRALPAASETVRCPCLTAEQAQTELPRFTALRNLALVQAGLSQLPGREVIDVLLRMPTLRCLSLPLGVLEDAEIARLAALPTLTELELTAAGNTPLACFTGQRLHELPHLRTLRLVHCDLTPDGWRSLAQAPTLTELAVDHTQTTPLPGAREALIASWTTLPHLARLTLFGDGFGEADVLAMVARTQVSALRLSFTPCTGESLARLRDLASLRDLSLRDAELGAGCIDALKTLRQVRSLDLVNTDAPAAAVAELRAALPECSIEAAPGTRVIKSFSEGKSGSVWR